MKNAVLAAPLLLLFGCAQPTSPPSVTPDLKAQLQSNDNAWAAAANRGDAAAVAAMYTENASMLPPGMDMQHGRAAIEKTVAGIGAAGIRNIVLTAIDVSQVGPDTAREIGRLSFDAPGPKKRLVKGDGKFVVVWKQVGGQWLLDTDIWNLNK